MALDVAVVVSLNLLLLALIVVGIVSVIYYHHQPKRCSERESDSCYTIHCPVDEPKSGPCFGFATRQEIDSKGTERSNAPSFSMNIEGKPITRTLQSEWSDRHGR